jgi:hypothetical protein
MSTSNKEARVRSIVEIQIPNGRGRFGQEWKSVKARVHMVLPTHLVCVLLGASGARPYLAETYRLIKW